MQCRCSILLTATLMVVSLSARAQYHHPSRILVKMKAGHSLLDQKDYRTLPLESFHHLKPIDVHVVHLPAGLRVDRAVEILSADPSVEYAEPDYVIYPQRAPLDPLYPEQWALESGGKLGGLADADLDLERAWDITTGDPNQVIAVLDTGIDFNAPEFDGQIFVNPNEIPNNNRDDDNNGYVDDISGWDYKDDDNDPTDDNVGHGTSCAGIIGAAANNNEGIAGINWQVKILPVRIMGLMAGFDYVSDAVEGMLYAASMGARVLSNSWGGPMAAQAMYDAIAVLESQDVLFVVASGNETHDIDQTGTYPAAFDLDNIISVAATDRFDHLIDLPGSWGSNWGRVNVDLSGPSEGVWAPTIPSSVSGSDEPYYYFSGTSCACPHVAGVAGLVLAAAPQLSFYEAKEILLNTVDPVPALLGKTQSGGRVNAGNAVLWASTPGLGGMPLVDGGDDMDLAMAEMATLTATATSPNGAIISAHWDFGDGHQAQGLSVSHRWTQPGVYTATVEVQDAVGLAVSDNVVVTVEPFEWVRINQRNIETPDSLGMFYQEEFEIEAPGALWLRVHFARFEFSEDSSIMTGNVKDGVTIKDHHGISVIGYTGDRGAFTTDPIRTHRVTLAVLAQQSRRLAGMAVDYVEAQYALPEPDGGPQEDGGVDGPSRIDLPQEDLPRADTMGQSDMVLADYAVEPDLAVMTQDGAMVEDVSMGLEVGQEAGQDLAESDDDAVLGEDGAPQEEDGAVAQDGTSSAQEDGSAPLQDDIVTPPAEDIPSQDDLTLPPAGDAEASEKAKETSGGCGCSLAP